MNMWLTLDYEIDRDLGYGGIDRARALEIVTTTESKINKYVRVEHEVDEHAVSAESVIGSEGVSDA